MQIVEEPAVEGSHNCKNYMTDGGDTLVIGGALVIENSADDACTPSHAGRLMAAASKCEIEHTVIQGANHYYFGQHDLAQKAAEVVRDWVKKQR